MEWEDKIKMVKMFNKNESWETIKDFISQHIDTFDVQAVDMLITALNLSKVKDDLRFFNRIGDKIKTLDNSKFGVRTKVRIAYLFNAIDEAEGRKK